MVFLVLVRVCQWINRNSPRLGTLVGLGLGVRVIAALGLFWTSYLHLPFASSLHIGRGFWSMALDAYTYHLIGMYGAEQGLLTLPAGASSQPFVTLLTVWMKN